MDWKEGRGKGGDLECGGFGECGIWGFVRMRVRFCC